MSTTEIDYAAATMTGEPQTVREIIVQTLAYLHHERDTRAIMIPVCHPDASSIITLERETPVWSGEPWDPTDMWLSDLITEVATLGSKGGVVTAWAYGTAAGGMLQVTTGFAADGEAKVTGLMHGAPIDIENPEAVNAYFIAQSKALWGNAWTPTW